MVASTRNLSIRLSVQDQDVVRRALERLGSQGQTALHRIGRASVPASRGLRTVSAAAIESRIALDAYAARAGRLGTVLTALGPRGKVAAVVIGVLTASLGVRQLTRYADEWTLIRNRIALFTKDAAETVKVQGELFKISQRTRVSMASTTELYQRLSQNSKELNISQRQVLSTLETINKTLIISGTDAASANAALIQLGQGLAANALRGQELNSVMEQTPRLALAIAAGMGVGIRELRELAKEGELTGKAVVDALLSQGEAVRAEFEGMTPTIGQAMNVLGNAMGSVIAQMNEATGASRLLATGITNIAEAIEALNAKGTNTQILPPFLPEGVVTAEQTGRVLPDPNARVTGDTLEVAKRQLKLSDQTITVVSAASDAIASFESTLKRVLGPRETPAGATQRTAFQMGTTSAGSTRMRSAAGDFLAQAGLSLPDEIEDLGSSLGGLRKGEMALAEVRERVHEASLTVNERESRLLKIRQAGERVTADFNGASQKQVDQMRVLHDQEREQINLGFDRVAAEKDVAEQQTKLNRIYQGGASIASRLVPQMRSFFDALASLARGDSIGLIINFFHGLLDVFGSMDDKSDALTQRMRALNDALRGAERSAIDTALSMGGAVSQEMKALQAEAVQPLLDALEAWQVRTGSNELDSLRLFISQLALIDELGFEKAGDDLSGVLENMGLSMVDFRLMLDRAFGSESTFRDVGARMFAVRDAFHDLFDELDSGAAKVTAAQNAARRLSDAERIASRSQFRGVFESAGSDRFAQAAAFGQISDQLAAVISAGDAVARRAGRPVSFTTNDSGDDPGTKKTTVEVDGVDIDLSGLNPIEVLWHHVLTMRQSDLVNEFGVTTYGDIVAFEGSLGRINAPWHHALQLSQARLVEDFGITRYEQIVAWEGNVAKIGVPCHHALQLSQARLVEDFDITRYEQIVAWEGNVAKIGVPWHHAVEFDLRHKLDRWDNVLDVSGARRIDVQIRDIFNFIGKVKLSDLIDMGEFNSRVDARVDSNNRNRRTSSGYNQYGRSQQRGGYSQYGRSQRSGS